MDTLLELAPLVAFFVAYQVGGIYVGVGVLMAAMVAMLFWRKITSRPISGMLWASTALALVFGGATLILHDVRFIQMKPTIFYWLLAIAFLLSRYVGAQTLAQRFLEPALDAAGKISSADWRRANLSWVSFWLMLGAANLYVVRNFSEAAWVKFKVIGTTALMFVFIVGQVLWLSRRTASPAAANTSPGTTSGSTGLDAPPSPPP